MCGFSLTRGDSQVFLKRVIPNGELVIYWQYRLLPVLRHSYRKIIIVVVSSAYMLKSLGEKPGAEKRDPIEEKSNPLAHKVSDRPIVIYLRKHASIRQKAHKPFME